MRAVCLVVFRLFFWSEGGRRKEVRWNKKRGFAKGPPPPLPSPREPSKKKLFTEEVSTEISFFFFEGASFFGRGSCFFCQKKKSGSHRYSPQNPFKKKLFTEELSPETEEL